MSPQLVQKWQAYIEFASKKGVIAFDSQSSGYFVTPKGYDREDELLEAAQVYIWGHPDYAGRLNEWFLDKSYSKVQKLVVLINQETVGFQILKKKVLDEKA